MSNNVAGSLTLDSMIVLCCPMDVVLNLVRFTALVFAPNGCLIMAILVNFVKLK